jgi:acetate kinase
MKVLVINCGSSSIKFELFAMPEEKVLAKGIAEKIGEEGGRLKCSINGHDQVTEEPIAGHDAGLKMIVQALTDTKKGGLGSPAEIGAVGHRVVHGGEALAQTTIITDEVVEILEDHVELAPLHNPPNLLGIAVAREVFPGVPQVAVFDTAFHQTMPEHAYLYPVPYELYEEHRVRRYGFHGTSHRYVAERAAQILRKPLAETNLITAHLGNGASITAIEGGKSVDTSMGMTPLEGLVMGTRCGDVDPALMPTLARITGKPMEEIDRIFNKESGMLGLTGMSNDMRTLEDAALEGNERADLALRIYCYRLKKYIGAYTAALGRVDALVFTGGVGENSDIVRQRSLEGMDSLGYALDLDKNAGTRGVEIDLSRPDSRSRVLVVPTNEELMIARETYGLAE